MTLATTRWNLGAVPSKDDPAAAVEWVFSLATSLDGFTSQIRRAYGLNAHERLAIAALWAQGSMTMTELGQWIPLSRAAVTTLVDRLEAIGMVQRTNDPGDRRRTMVVLVESALDAWAPVFSPWAMNIATLIGELSPEEWAVVVRFGEQLRRVNGDEVARLQQMTDEQLHALVGTKVEPAKGVAEQ